jgi:hypothetical protein
LLNLRVFHQYRREAAVRIAPVDVAKGVEPTLPKMARDARSRLQAVIAGRG